MTLETYAEPFIGSLPVASIGLPEVLSVLQQPTSNPQKPTLWEAKNETASRLRGRIEAVLDWATVSGYREGDNAARWRGYLQHRLPAPRKVQKVKHFAALPFAEMGAFMTELRKREGVAARAVEFAVLTAARSNEVRGCRWSEIDLKAHRWIIPAARMKAAKEHRIPLSPSAVALLKALPRVEGSDYVFAAPRGGKLSDMSLTAVLRRMKRDAVTVHGFRSSFKDWAGETTKHTREVIEHALAHQLKDKAEAAYQHGVLFEKRIALMKDWANYCGNVKGKVVEFPQKQKRS